MKSLKKNTINTKQRYSEFTKLTSNELSQIRGGENPPTQDEKLSNEPNQK